MGLQIFAPCVGQLRIWILVSKCDQEGSPTWNTWPIGMSTRALIMHPLALKSLSGVIRPLFTRLSIKFERV